MSDIDYPVYEVIEPTSPAQAVTAALPPPYPVNPGSAMVLYDHQSLAVARVADDEEMEDSDTVVLFNKDSAVRSTLFLTFLRADCPCRCNGSSDIKQMSAARFAVCLILSIRPLLTGQHAGKHPPEFLRCAGLGNGKHLHFSLARRSPIQSRRCELSLLSTQACRDISNRKRLPYVATMKRTRLS